MTARLCSLASAFASGLGNVSPVRGRGDPLLANCAWGRKGGDVCRVAPAEEGAMGLGLGVGNRSIPGLATDGLELANYAALGSHVELPERPGEAVAWKTSEGVCVP